jgi:hypothetical protein
MVNVMQLGKERIIYRTTILLSTKNGTTFKSWDEIFIRGRDVTP